MVAAFGGWLPAVARAAALALRAAVQLEELVDLVPVVVDLVAYKEPHPCYLQSMTQPPLIIKLVPAISGVIFLQSRHLLLQFWAGRL